jgi:hypothetical protein
MLRRLVFAFALSFAAAAVAMAAAGDAPRRAPSLARADLMNAVFDGWRADKPCCWKLRVPDGIQWSPWLPTPGETPDLVDTDPVSVVPLHVVRLDETHAALMTVSAPMDDKGKVLCGHSCDHYVGVVFFSAEDGQWVQRQRIDAAAWVAEYPAKNWVQRWPGHGYLVSFTSGSCWTGACSDDVVLLGLQPDHLQPLLATSFDESDAAADAGGTDESCGDLLSHDWQPSPHQRFDLPLDCREASGAWRLDGDHVVFNFRGSSRTSDSKGRAGPLKTWTRQVTLGLQGDRLVPLSGTLPGFGF